VNGLLICDDLIFTSKVTATARAKGLHVVPVRSFEAALKAAAQEPPDCVIVDLHNQGLNIQALLAGLSQPLAASRSIPPTMPKVIAFGSHVDVETLRAAREAGCDLVMPRSQFVKRLEGDLKGWFGEPRSDQAVLQQGE